MSYRLIDANAIAESYPEANDMPCIYVDLPRGLDGGHYDMRELSELQRDNAKLRVFASCAYGIASKFMRLNGCPYYDNEMECSLSEECEEKDWAEQPDCLLDVLAKALGIEVGE